jgi:hypothetical protein
MTCTRDSKHATNGWPHRWRVPSTLAAGLLLRAAGCTGGTLSPDSDGTEAPEQQVDEDDGSEPAAGAGDGTPSSDGLTPEEIAELYVEFGFEARVLGDAVDIPGGVPDEQRDAASAAFSECSERIEGPPVTLTAEVVGTYYDDLLEAAACLRDEGVEVDDPPSRDAFIDGMLNAQVNVEGAHWWSPYANAGAVAGYSDAEWQAFQAACPQPELGR